jgi:hypothetical protein
VVLGTQKHILEFAGNIDEIWKKVAELVPVSALPTPPDGSKYIIEHF